MGFTRNGAGLYRVLALPAARLSAAAAACVLGVCLFAGAVRILPLILGPGLPLRVGVPLARGVLGVSLETALFVAPPLAWALACARLVERGEARALFALGIRPLRIVVGAWPSAFALAVAAALASTAWGREASAPGRLARDLIVEAREACSAGAAGASRIVAVDVPTLGFSWVCFPGEAPRIVGPAPIGRGAAVLSASGVDVSDDLRAIRLVDAVVAFSASGPEPPHTGALPSDEAASGSEPPRTGARLHAAEVSIQGLPPLGRASNLGVLARTILMASGAAVLAAVSALTVLARSVKSRAFALAIGLSGPAAALMVFSTLERSPSPPIAYGAVPLAGLTVTFALAGIARMIEPR